MFPVNRDAPLRYTILHFFLPHHMSTSFIYQWTGFLIGQTVLQSLKPGVKMPCDIQYTLSFLALSVNKKNVLVNVLGSPIAQNSYLQLSPEN